MNYRFFASPVGTLRLVSDGKHLVAIEFDSAPAPREGDRDVQDKVLEACATQLGEYFAGRRTRFELPLAPAGTAFQREVWAALEKIPYGALSSYAEIARTIGRPAATRAVGAANGRNPLPIVIPCHRVIGSDGSLTGYGGGLEKKRRLLSLEGAPLPAR